jgi:DNA-binding beta-propeller fold protein YncE
MKTMMKFFGIMVLLSGSLAAQQTTIPFDEAHWNLAGARVMDYLGRPALMGTAVLKDLEFENGVIEYDQAVRGGRSYPGVMFRAQADGSWERFYIRPHRSGRVAPSLYSDVLQYVPSWNRVDSWQLYSGAGYTSGAVIPADKWFHVKIEVSGERARVFLDQATQPSFDIPRLRHGLRRGGITLMGPADGSAYYSNFSVREDNTIQFGPVRRQNPAPGFVRSWQVSQAFNMLDIDGSGPGLPVEYAGLKWRDLPADEDGLVDVARVQARSGPPDTVFLKTVISAERAEVRPYRFGYSDIATVYLNGLKVFSGNSQYQGRDPSFLGIIGPNDILSLPLRAGNNEVVVVLSEISGGWGCLLQYAEAEFRASGLTDLWKTAKRFAVPESVAYDPAKQMLYVSNYDPYTPSGPEGLQTISKIGLQGGEPQVLARGLRNPTGLVVFKDRLFAVESNGVAEIDIATGAIARRISVPGASFLNDIAVDGEGTLYVSDPSQGAIHRISGGKVEVWLQGPDVRRPNGVCLSGNNLVWANNGDGRLKAADLNSKQIRVLADLNGGIIDGLATGPDGSLLVSHNEGRLFQVKASGEVTVLLDRTVAGIPIGDFTFIIEKNILVFPTFTDNRVMAFSGPASTARK